MEDSYVLQLQEPKFREFYLSYSGYAQCGPLHCYGPASRPHYLIHFVVKGKGMYQASGQKHYLTAGQGFLIEPGTQTFYQADKDDPWSYLWIGVGGNNAGKYIRDIGLNSEQLIFRSESGEELKKIVLDILKHTESTTSNLYYLQGRLYDFFSVLTKDVVIDTYLGNSKEKKNGSENKYGETYNVGSGRAVEIQCILDMIISMSYKDIKIEVDPNKIRPVDVPIIEADISKLNECTGWEPAITIKQTIEETLNYWRSRAASDKNQN